MTEKEAKAYLRDHIVFMPRHLKQCRDDNGYSEYQSLKGNQRCGCPYAGCGPFPGEGYKRRSTGSTSLEKAEKIVLKWLITGDSRSRDEVARLLLTPQKTTWVRFEMPIGMKLIPTMNRKAR